MCDLFELASRAGIGEDQRGDALSVELVNVLTGSKDAATAMKDANAAMIAAME